MEVDFHDEREFTKWMCRLAGRDRTRVDLLLLALAQASGPLGMPQGRRLAGEPELYELRSGSGHRVYYAAAESEPDEPQRRAVILAQGTKDTQTRDIERARSRQS